VRVGILRVGAVDEEALTEIRSGLCEALPGMECVILEGSLPIPSDAYSRWRGQYHSSLILRDVYERALELEVDCVLGVTEVDLYVDYLNFVFGEAQCPGRAALISLHRLRPEFYGQPPNRELFLLRAVKEAVHEVGHAVYGLKHCPNPGCVMRFSNSILEVDMKGRFLCEKCRSRAEKALLKKRGGG